MTEKWVVPSSASRTSFTDFAAHASDVIAEATVAMEFHASCEDLARSFHAHPTLPEALKEAAMAVDKMQIHS